VAAANAARGGEDYARFDPSDLTSWSYWIRGKNQMADVQFERGAVDASLGTAARSGPAGGGPAAAGSLAPLVFQTWLRIAYLEAGRGRSAEAEQAFAEGMRGSKESLNRFSATDERRQLFANSEATARARMLFNGGDAKGASMARPARSPASRRSR
jgi:hypothetical protein